MHVYFISSKVTLKCAECLFVEARGSKAAQREECQERFKIYCYSPFPLPQRIILPFPKL